jgi:hypothetical protein
MESESAMEDAIASLADMVVSDLDGGPASDSEAQRSGVAGHVARWGAIIGYPGHSVYRAARVAGLPCWGSRLTTT